MEMWNVRVYIWGDHYSVQLVLNDSKVMDECYFDTWPEARDWARKWCRERGKLESFATYRIREHAVKV